MSSQNKVSIQGLISAIANGINAGQQTDLFQKISNDLDKVFSQVNSGPLPENSAVNLKHIQASEIDGVIARANLPPLIAYDDVANPFTQDQTITKALATMFFKVVSATKFGRVEAVADGRTLFSSNLFYTGSAYSTDTGNGAGVEFLDDNIKFRQRTGGTDKIPFEIDTTSVIKIGNPAVTGGIGAGETIIPNNKGIWAVNQASNDAHQLVKLDANNLVVLGGTAQSGGNPFGHINIPSKSSVNLPNAGASSNGIIVIDSTNTRLCYYTGGLRYFIPAGTSF